MRKVVLISCVRKKLRTRARAKDLYASPLFQLCYEYAKMLRPDAIFILSAKYGLVRPEQYIAPYDVTLNSMSPHEIREWASRVVCRLRQWCDLAQDHFILLAGRKYRKPLIPHLDSYEVPMEGLSIGKQLQYLGRQLYERAV